MENILLIVLVVIVAILILGIAFLSKKLSALSKPQEDESGKLTQALLQQQEAKIDRTRQEMNELLAKQNELLNSGLNNSQKNIQQQFMISQRTMTDGKRETTEIIKAVTEKLTTLEKTNSQIVDFAKQLESLEKILKNPKQRGILGEYFLETTLKNVLPPDGYQMQYKFKNGEIVDAVVFIKDKIVPIDSKFSLENYNRIVNEDDPSLRGELEKTFREDLKHRIDETSKYIRPEEGTMSFAFMFIPSEGVYYDLLVNKVGAIKINTQDLISYAFAEKGVIIVSPTSFLAYLQTVLQGLRALKIEESALEIKENVIKLSKHLKAYEEYFGKIGKNLGTTVNSYNYAHKELLKVDKDVFKISGESIEITSDILDNPDI